MRIKLHKQFKKQYKKLPAHTQDKTKVVITIFARDPHDVRLKNHALTGKLQGLRAISVTGDIRIIFEEHRDYMLVVFLDIGTHNRVYR